VLSGTIYVRVPAAVLLLRTYPGLQNFFGLERVFLAHQHLKSTAGPGYVWTHSSGGVGLNDGVDLCSFQSAQGHVGLKLVGKGVDYDEIVILHVHILGRLFTTETRRHGERLGETTKGAGGWKLIAALQ
jgi:hypothetical protein